MFNLGFMHEFGVGVYKDLRLAGKFYNMAGHTQVCAAARGVDWGWEARISVTRWWISNSVKVLVT